MHLVNTVRTMSTTKKFLLAAAAFISLGAVIPDPEVPPTPEQAARDAANQEARLAVQRSRLEAHEARMEAERKHTAELAGTACTKDRKALIGETPQRTLKCGWGKPQRVNRTVHANFEREQWVYGDGNYLYFVNGRLTTIQN